MLPYRDGTILKTIDKSVTYTILQYMPTYFMYRVKDHKLGIVKHMPRSAIECKALRAYIRVRAVGV